MSSVSSTSSSSSSYYYALQKKTFDRLDTDKNGSLDQNELQSGKPKTITKEQASKLYDLLDTDKSGAITMNELAAGTQSGAGMGLISQLPSDALDVLLRLQQQGGGMPQAGTGGSGDQTAGNAAYDALDTNRDGVVSEDEFLAAHPEQLTDKDAKSLFQNLDTDKDGKLTQDQMKTVTEVTTPARLMGPSFFGQDPATGQSTSSSGGMSSLFGNVNGANSAYQLFNLLESQSLGTGG
jgi:Ca2+-binding EF-hand superfamily protein